MNTAIYDMNDNVYHASTSPSRPVAKRWPAWVAAWAMVVMLGVLAGVWLADQWGWPVAKVVASTADADPGPPQAKAVPPADSPQPSSGQSTNGAGRSAAPQNGSKNEKPAKSEPPKGPCAGVHGEDAKKLVATPNPVHLKGSSTKGSFTIHNCSHHDIHWSASTKSWVALDDSAGALVGRSKHKLTFTVDTSGLPYGPYSFTIKVSQPGHDVHVHVTGNKPKHTPAPAPTANPAVTD